MLSLLTNLPREVLIQQIYDGLVLLVLGMGTVFVFLVILIYATKLMSKICMKFDKPAAQPVKKTSQSAPSAKPAVSARSNDAAIAAAIAAAYDKDR